MRAIRLKSSPLRFLVRDGGGVGTNSGVGVIGSDCGGAEGWLPGMPLEGSIGVACPPGVATGYGCEGGRYVLCAVECAGGEASDLLPIDTGGVFCPPFDNGAKGEPDCAIEAGGGAEVFTSGSEGEDGVIPGVGLEELGMIYVGIYSPYVGNTVLPRLSGTCTFRASAIAAASDEALGKRVAGSFARQRKMTISSIGGMFGLMSEGEGGVAVMCWVITAVGLSP